MSSDPDDAEHDHPVRHDHPFQDLRLTIGGSRLDDRHDRFGHFAHGLMKLGFARRDGNELVHERSDLHSVPALLLVLDDATFDIGTPLGLYSMVLTEPKRPTRCIRLP